MKRTVSVACALVLVLGLLVSGALATYDIPNTTQVQPWYLTSSNGAFQDAATNPIQNAGTHEFETYGANWNPTTHILTIFSNWGPARDGSLGVTTADLFIDRGCDGTYDFAVGLDTGRAGHIYSAAINTTSQNLFDANGGVIYGGVVDPASPHAIPVLGILSPNNLTIPVTWNTLAGLPDYSVDVDLTGQVSGDFGFIWGSGTCANGPMESCVPIPPSVLLMGSGLLGMGLIGWRRRSSEGQVG